MHYSLKLFAICTLAGSTSLASAAPMEDYNMILFGDFAPNGGSGHIQGKSFIGGDLKGDSPVFGYMLDKSLTSTTVEVAGNLSASQPKVEAGYLSYGGDNNTYTINCNGSSFGGSQACVQKASGLDSKAADLYTELSNDSAYYNSLSSTGSIGGNLFSYSGAATELAVFDISGGDLFAQNSNWNLDFGLAENIVINVSGVDLYNSSSVHFNGNFSNSGHILWNFYEAEYINLDSSPWYGSILAVDAAIATGNDINGTLVADSYIGNGQIHLPTWSYDPPETSVPEPSMILLMLTGLGFMSLRKFRRS